MTKTKKIHNMNKKHTRKNKYTKKAHKLKKRVKQPNKRFRKTRSKRQRGGKPAEDQEENPEENQEENQEEKDKYLFDAIKIGNIDEVENALNNGANVNAKNAAGYTPLIHAITTDNIIDDTRYEMVQLLLDQPGIEVNAKNDDGHTPLICAITSNNRIYIKKYDMVELLLDQPNIEFDIDTVILAEGQEVDDQDQQGIPALIESYILAKNEIKDNKNKNIEEIKKMAKQMRKSKFPSLSELACENLTLEQRQQLARCSWGVNSIGHIDYGGKRKTRKSKQKRRLN